MHRKDAKHAKDMSVALRSVGAVLVIIGALFKIQHWPFSTVLLVGGWLCLAIAMVVRLLRNGTREYWILGRDLLVLGLIGVWMMRMLHWPLSGIAWCIVAIGLVLSLRFGWNRYGPKIGERYPAAVLFGSAVVLIVLGTLFRIQHWPHSTPLLIIGLVMVGAWFLITQRDERPPSGPSA